MSTESLEYLEKDGYQYNGRLDSWSKVLEESNLTLQGFGEGNYNSTHRVKELGGMLHESLDDYFEMEDDVLLLRRISPYPFDKWTSVEINTFGKTFGGFSEISFRYLPIEMQNYNWTTGTHLTFRSPDAGRVNYGKNGDLEQLNIGSGEANPFVSFNFTKGEVFDSVDNKLGEISEFLNTGKKLLFNERFYNLNSTDCETNVSVIHPVGNRELVSVSVPPKIHSMDNIIKIMTETSKDWLSLGEYLPLSITVA